MKDFVRSISIIALSGLALSAPSAFAEETGTIEGTEEKKPEKITDRGHPDYVRCRSEPIIGSLSRKRRICMTNAQWVAYTRKGSSESKEFVDDNQPGFMATPN
ncbi:MAG: hypothetical protein ABJP02_08470 [Parasphingorhabdus sp.]|uniref:hypothetical protein n=1 Tax=Parasphingorhabdus sp. TaxID=2709688 RepID=UPI00329A7E68